MFYFLSRDFADINSFYLVIACCRREIWIQPALCSLIDDRFFSACIPTGFFLYPWCSETYPECRHWLLHLNFPFWFVDVHHSLVQNKSFYLLILFFLVRLPAFYPRKHLIMYKVYFFYLSVSAIFLLIALNSMVSFSSLSSTPWNVFLSGYSVPQ